MENGCGLRVGRGGVVEVQVLNVFSMSFQVAPSATPQTSYLTHGAFRADRLSLTHYLYPMDRFRRKYRHLRSLPIQSLKNAKPLLLTGLDQSHLNTSKLSLLHLDLQVGLLQFILGLGGPSKDLPGAWGSLNSYSSVC